MSDERQIFTLQQVTSSIRKTFETRYKQSYWIKAEMHKLNLYPSGHAFPELVQKVEDKIVAQMSAKIWKENLNRINKAFSDTVNEPLTEGVTLLMEVKITFSELHGISLQILTIDPKYTLGELQKERAETLKRLLKEGLLNRNQLLRFPLLPKRIAVISAASSKGLSDFYQVLHENPWNYQFFTFLFPAYLQGDVAVGSIQAQLEQIRRVVHHFDIVVIVRGGGGEVGLSCYNHFELCKAIASFPIPILTGIGHSTNLTVAEMIAFRNAITPTELADFLLQSFHDFSQPVKAAEERIADLTKRLMDQCQLSFLTEIKNFRNAYGLFFSRSKHELSLYSQLFRHESNAILIGSQERVNATKKHLSSTVQIRLKNEDKQLIDYKTVLPALRDQKLRIETFEIQRIENLVRVLDPIHVLRRGYAIARFNQRSINASNMPNIGDEIAIETEKSVIQSKVVSVRDLRE